MVQPCGEDEPNSKEEWAGATEGLTALETTVGDPRTHKQPQGAARAEDQEFPTVAIMALSQNGYGQYLLETS